MANQTWGQKIQQYSRDRQVLILLGIFILVPLGLLSKAYSGIGQHWINDYSGDVLYEIFWCLIIFWLIPTIKDLPQVRAIAWKIALGVFLVTCAIEVSQLWFYLVPQPIRSHLLWRLLLGAGFAWWDFPHYALGSIIGWWSIVQIAQRSQQRT